LGYNLLRMSADYRGVNPMNPKDKPDEKITGYR
jgi:hypothetical protein